MANDTLQNQLNRARGKKSNKNNNTAPCDGCFNTNIACIYWKLVIKRGKQTKYTHRECPILRGGRHTLEVGGAATAAATLLYVDTIRPQFDSGVVNRRQRDNLFPRLAKNFTILHQLLYFVPLFLVRLFLFIPRTWKGGDKRGAGVLLKLFLEHRHNYPFLYRILGLSILDKAVYGFCYIYLLHSHSLWTRGSMCFNGPTTHYHNHVIGIREVRVSGATCRPF